VLWSICIPTVFLLCVHLNSSIYDIWPICVFFADTDIHCRDSAVTELGNCHRHTDGSEVFRLRDTDLIVSSFSFSALTLSAGDRTGI